MMDLILQQNQLMDDYKRKQQGPNAGMAQQNLNINKSRIQKQSNDIDNLENEL